MKLDDVVVGSAEGVDVNGEVAAALTRSRRASLSSWEGGTSPSQDESAVQPLNNKQTFQLRLCKTVIATLECAARAQGMMCCVHWNLLLSWRLGHSTGRL